MNPEPFQPLYTPGARRLYHFEYHEDEQLLTAEVRRTIDALAASVPARIDKGGLTRDEAADMIALWTAIADDLTAHGAWIAAGRGASSWSLATRLRELRAANGVSWPAKIAALRREIEARRTGYPAQVGKGLLTSEAAKAQLECLEAVHDLYWRHGYAFDGTREELRELSGAVMDHNLHDQAAAA